MKKTQFLFFAVFLILLTSRLYSQDMDFKFKIISYGSYESNVVRKESMSGSPTGTRSLLDKLVLLDKTFNIPCRIGSQFGIEYILRGKKTELVTLNIEWVFPNNMVTKKGEEIKSFKYPVDLMTNSKFFSLYLLEDNYELIGGLWQLNIYYGNKLINHEEFILK